MCVCVLCVLGTWECSNTTDISYDGMYDIIEKVHAKASNRMERVWIYLVGWIFCVGQFKYLTNKLCRKNTPSNTNDQCQKYSAAEMMLHNVWAASATEPDCVVAQAKVVVSLSKVIFCWCLLWLVSGLRSVACTPSDCMHSSKFINHSHVHKFYDHKSLLKWLDEVSAMPCNFLYRDAIICNAFSHQVQIRDYKILRINLAVLNLNWKWKWVQLELRRMWKMEIFQLSFRNCN